MSLGNEEKDMGPNFDNSNSGSDVYFAAKKAEETASILMNRAFSFYNTLRANAYLEKLNKMWRA